MINFGNISIVDLRLGATQVGAAYLGNKQVWSLGPVVPKYDIKSIGRSVLRQGTSIEITEEAGETITLYIKTNATDLTNKQVCAAVYLNSTDVTPYASFAFSNVSLTGRYITGTTPDVSTWVPSGFPETYSILYMKTWIQDTGYIDPADALGEVLDWTGEELAPIWLSFTAEQANSTVRLDKVGSPDAVSLETSTDGTTWTDYSWTGNTGDTLTLVNVGDKVYMRAKNENDHFAIGQTNCHQFIMTGTIAASGNLQTLLKADGSRTDIGTTGQGFRKLFIDCTSLTSAPELPATTLIPHGYEDLFKGCTNLSIGPTELPAQTAVQECYRGIFSGCSSLVAAPKIAAINFGAYACAWMFEHCSSLNSIEVVFSTWPGQSATLYWVSDVAASGTFTCPAELPDTRGDNNIPTGWQVVNPTIAVEYIESDGTQYINTGINGNTVYGVEFSFMAPAGVEQTTAWANPLASVMDNFTLGFYNRETSRYFLRWRTNEVFQAIAYAGVKQTLEISQNTITLGDSSYTIATPQPVCTASGNIMICTNTALSRLAKVKIYGLKLYDSSFNLLRDLVPVRVGNTGYLYDNVSNTLFGNSGSGEFIIGPDV